MRCLLILCFFKQKTAYELRISDWISDVCSSDLSTIVMGRRVLRPGPIPEVELKRYFPGQDQGSPTNRSDAGPRPSPGKGVVSPVTLPSHSAPSNPLRLHATSAATHDRDRKGDVCGKKVAGVVDRGGGRVKQ